MPSGNPAAIQPRPGRGTPRVTGWSPLAPVVPPLHAEPSHSPGSPAQWLTGTYQDRFLIIPVSEVVCLEAEGNYVLVAARGERFRLRGPLHEVASKLASSQFVQVHRSRVVNVHHVREIVPTWQGDFELVMSDGSRVRMSRTYRAQFR